MFEPATLLGLLTLWAQLNNYGIDIEKNPHLKDVRVRRAIENQLYGVHNRLHDSKTGLKDTVIMKSVLNGIEKNRPKRSNDYVEATIPLASYPKNSPYHTQNTAGVPYYYSPYTEKNTAFYGYTGNKGQSVTNGNRGQSVTNGNRGQSVTNGNTGQSVTNGNTGQNVPTGSVGPYQSNSTSSDGKRPDYRNTHMTSGKYVMPNNGFYSNSQNIGVDNTYGNAYNAYGSQSKQGTSSLGQYYNPYSTPYNQTIIPLTINVNNNIIAHNNTQHGKHNTKNNNIGTAAFMSGIGCPKFMQSITVFGRQVCVDANDDYE